MFLNGVKVMLRVIGAVVILAGAYLIFVEKQFFGIFAIIIGFVILPIVERRKIHQRQEQDGSRIKETDSENEAKNPTTSYDREDGG